MPAAAVPGHAAPCCLAEQSLCGTFPDDFDMCRTSIPALHAHALSSGSAGCPTSRPGNCPRRPETAILTISHILRWHACWRWPFTAAGSPCGETGACQHQEPSSRCLCPSRSALTILLCLQMNHLIQRRSETSRMPSVVHIEHASPIRPHT